MNYIHFVTKPETAPTIFSHDVAPLLKLLDVKIHHSRLSLTLYKAIGSVFP